jgi:Lon protease-like protein
LNDSNNGNETQRNAATRREVVPLFPLQSVLFPGGLLNLKVFEARYLDLVSDCLRTGQRFGVVCLRQGSDVQAAGETTRFEDVGVFAELSEVDSEQAGILRVKCIGRERFEIRESKQEANGLWIARVRPLEPDSKLPPMQSTFDTVRALANAIATLKQQGSQPFLEPYAFDDAGWVANRWCELLPVPLAAKQRLMALDNPLVRLKLVDEFLRGKGVVG